MSNWLDQLLHSHAAYLVAGKQPDVPPAPELTYAKHDPAHFQALFENDAGAVFRITR
jgi:hypothetical protein